MSSSGDSEGEAPEFRILAIGDTGYTGNQQNDVARAMAEVGGNCVLLLGDNFYPCGVRPSSEGADSVWFDPGAKVSPAVAKKNHDRAWKESFKDCWHTPFLKPHTALQVPWYAVLGNHDYEYHADWRAQIDFTASEENAALGGHWQMPYRGYRIRYDLATREPEDPVSLIDDEPFPDTENPAAVFAHDGFLECVDLFGIDTSGCQDCMAREIPGLVRVVEDQVAALDRHLAASRARFKIVFAHHPCYTAGNDHCREGVTLRESGDECFGLEEVLVRHDVDVYVAGHEHVLQSVRVKGVDHCVAGTGCSMGFYRGFNARSQPPMDFVGGENWSDAGFLEIVISSDRKSMRGNFRKIDGQTHYSFLRQKGKAAEKRRRQ